MNFVIIGCGNKLYGANFNKTARNLNQSLRKLGAKRIVPVFMGNADVDMNADYDKWLNGYWRAFKRFQTLKEKQQESIFKILF